MKSLVLLNENRAHVSTSSSKSSKICYDPINKITFVASIVNEDTCVINSILKNEEVKEITSFPVISDDEIEIICLNFLLDTENICLFLSNGEIYSIKLDEPDNVDNIGSIEPGILAVSWSPDEELFATYTSENKLIIMTKDFEVISEKQIHEDEELQEEYVNVGWGKKETQFHGSVGKQAAKETVDHSTFTLSQDDDLKPRLSWRGDGNFLVCSLIDNVKNIRIMKVYDREGMLQNSTELIDKLEHNVFWKPSGSLIASTQRLPHRYQVVFFEKNGLRHGEFTLPTDVKRVLELKWNCDSTILALLVQKNEGASAEFYLQFWYVNNYFWYLKYDLPLPEYNNNIHFIFHPEIPLNIAINFAGSEFLSLDFDWEVLNSNNLSIENSLTTAVINGKDLYLTPFRYRNVPPPMSAFQPKFPVSIQHISFSNFDHGNRIAVLDFDQNLYVVKFEEISKKKITPPEIKKVGNLSEVDLSDSIKYRQLCYSSENEIYALGYCTLNLKDYVAKFSISENSKNFELVDKIECSSPVIKIIHQEGSNEPIIQFNDGKIYRIKGKDNELEFELGLSEKCTLFQAVKYDEYSDLKVAALSSSNRLYINQILIDSNCTSFAIHNEFLVYTTSDHVARFLPINANLYENPPSELSKELEPYSRNLERGSKIISVAPHDVSLILQMPRGNLETINPRALVLASVRESLQSKSYSNAFIQCRKHRIDLNVLFDENPTSLLQDMQMFVDQVNDPDYLNLFVSTLRDDNVINTKYPRYKYSGNSDLKDLTAYPNKVNLICAAVRDALKDKDIKQYVQTIITTYARQLPADLESILSLLKDLKDKDPTFAEKTLKYAIFLANVDQLYDVALGMYDFSLVIMVAKHSQKDPKEYLPFLDELKKLEPNYQKFKIDQHLKRFDKALQNISRADDNFEECLSFIKEHSLYQQALKLYERNSEQYKIIMSSFAAYLHSSKKYQDAGTAYLAIMDYQNALPSLLKVGNWQQALICTKALNYSDEQVLEVVDDLISYLKHHNRHLEAFSIIEKYKKDPEEATACLLEGHLWTNAIINSETSNRKDLVETDIKPAIITNLEQITEDLNDMSDQFSKQRTRVHELQNLPPPTIPDFDAPGLENVEIQSDATSAFNYTVYTHASTNITNQSMGSTKTGKSRRKLERKKNRGKKGSVFEYEYLLASISRLVERANNMQADIKLILIGLTTLSLFDEARKLQELFEEVLNDLNNDLDWIYKPAEPSSNLELLIARSKGEDGNPIQIVPKPTLVLNGKWKLEIL
ncbi:IkappaB kinase complex, IKAP component [Neoconidiobolus thromboides FSU 785]|nr:IkappaB kinase complex, IKAP component [Neoconidiobolus thromboides FSU 785]